MSNQLSAFCGWISWFMSMAASCWQGRAMFITCIPQPARSGEERRTRGSFQCLRKQMTWMLLYGTLNTQNNTSALGYIKVQLPRKVSLVSRFCKRHQSSSTGTKNWYRGFAFTAVFADTGLALPNHWKGNSDESNGNTCTRSPSSYYTVIKESANISVRFKFQKATNILSKHVCKQMVTLSFLLKHHQLNSNCWVMHFQTN